MSQPHNSAFPLDYSHFQRENVPFIGVSNQMTPNEYANKAQRLRIPGYGLFDVDTPDQECFGLTLAELLKRSYAEQCHVMVFQPIHDWHGEGDERTLRMKIWAIWYEQYDTSASNAATYLQTGQLPKANEANEAKDKGNRRTNPISFG